MKVGIVCPYDLGAPGGVQQVCIEMAARLIEAGDEAVVVGPGADPPQVSETLPMATTTVGRPIRIRANKSVSPIALSAGSWAQTKSALEGVDVVHIHEPLMPLVGWASMGVDAAKVATFHADPPRWVDPLYRLLPLRSRMNDFVLTAVSEVAHQSIPGAWGETRLIPNAVDVASYASDQPRVAKRIAFLGRDEPRKGLDIALEAFAKVRQIHPDSEMIVMSADRSDPPTGVTFLGWVTEEEKRRVLSTSEIYVAPNTGGESFGMVLTEAMASGCAVVASDIDGFRDVLRDDGALVPVGDIEHFAEVIDTLLGDRERSRELGERGRRAVKRFDWPVVFGQYRQAYEDALSR